MQKKIFVDIDGTNGHYQISNYGRVYSVRFNRMLKGHKTGKQGHLHVKLGSYFSDYIHRLVGKAFVPNPDNKPEIDHIDCNPSNNYFENLRWVTRKENLNNPLTIEHYKKSNKNKAPKGYYEKKDRFNKELGIKHKGMHIKEIDGKRQWCM